MLSIMYFRKNRYPEAVAALQKPTTPIRATSLIWSAPPITDGILWLGLLFL